MKFHMRASKSYWYPFFGAKVHGEREDTAADSHIMHIRFSV